MIELSELLEKEGLDPACVMVMRHRPTEPALRKALPWLAAEKPDIYNAYQSQHGPSVERSLARASHLASFIGHESAKALFVGIYRVVNWKQISAKQFWAMKSNKALAELGIRGPKDGRRARWFTLRKTKHLAQWKGKLVVDWPGIERSWWRWASRHTFTVQAIHEQSRLVASMPHWSELILGWPQLRSLPTTWRTAIAQWRGIYIILDTSTGKSYVGSAYGADNILGRWLGYASTRDGGNIALRKLDPTRLQFAILERVSPDMAPDDVIRLEATWKDRLGTREHGLNKN